MADEYAFDPWEGSSGLPDDLTVKITDASFTYNTEINPDNLFLLIEGTVVEGDGDEFAQYFSCGKGWEPREKGERAVREDGKDKQFNNNCAYYHLFASLYRAAVEAGTEDALRKRGNPFHAGLWKGLTVFLKRHPYTFKDRDTGEQITRDRLLIDRLVGGLEGGKPSARGTSTSTSTSTSKAKAPRKAEPEGESDEAAAGAAGAAGNGAAIDGRVKAKLKVWGKNAGLAEDAMLDLFALAGSADSFNEFMEMAFEVDGVLDNAAAEALVTNEDDGGVWALAHP